MNTRLWWNGFVTLIVMQDDCQQAPHMMKGNHSATWILAEIAILAPGAQWGEKYT